MNQRCLPVDSKAYVRLLQACIANRAVSEGKRVHIHMIGTGLKPGIFVGNRLLEMYIKCGRVCDARQVFEKLPSRDVFSWNTMISGVRSSQGCGGSSKTLLANATFRNEVNPIHLSHCSQCLCRSFRLRAGLPSLEQGKQTHAGIIRTGLESNVFAGSALVDMYAKCGSIKDARLVFDKMSERDEVSWTAMIAGYAQRGLGDEALKLFYQMQQLGVKPDQVTFTTVLTACVTSGRLEDAHQVFSKMPERNVVSWNAMISGYAQNEHEEKALKLFLQMQRVGIKPTQSTFASILSACAGLSALEQGHQIHAKIIQSGLESNIFVGSALINMYAKCGSIGFAQELFDIMPEQNVVSWNAMIAGYTQNGYGEEALKLFCQMRWEGVGYDQVTYASILSACASLESMEHGKQVHARIIRTGFQSNVFVRNALVDMYAKCGSIKDACQLFQKMHERDVVTWNAMIVGYAQNGHGEEALNLFSQMVLSGVKPDQVGFSSVLSACASLTALEHGKQVHGYIIKTGFELNAFVGSALVDMYAKCGSMKHADVMLSIMPEPNVVSWNAIIAGYVQNSNGKDALSIFCQMQQTGMKATQFTFASILAACGSLPSVDQGKQVHAYIIKTGFESNLFVGSALVDMYAKCESIVDAHRLFYEMPERNKIAWTAIIGGYAQNGHGEEVLKLFWQMKGTDVKPDQATFASVLRACANSATLQHGRQVHGHIIQTAFESNVYAGSSLVDMYAKCGAIEDACQVFNAMPKKDVISWNAMISGYAQNGHGENALQLYEQMIQASMKPDYITFIGVLSACSHAGLVEEGRHYFKSMIQDHCIKPRSDHYTCMIDLLGRAGHFDEAEDFISNMPFEPDASMWGALLAACTIHGNEDLGKRAAKSLIELEPQSSAPYVMLSNIYSAAGRWDDVTMVRKMMRDTGVKKKPGFSWIEVKNRVHAFMVGDRSHVQTEEIYAMLDRLAGQMKAAGYVPDTNSVLRDVEA